MRKVKLFLLIALLTTVSVVQGQIRFGVKGGINVANASFSKDVIDTKNFTGFNLGPVIELMLGDVGLGFDAAVLYTQKGFKAEERTVSNSYLQVPVNLKYKFITPVIKPYLAAGPYIDLKVAGDDTWSIAGVEEQIKSQSFGAGLNFGAGVELINMIQVGINVNWGLTDNYKSFETNSIDSYKGKSITWSGSAIVFF
ncbi:MAG: PorT family protein [Tannerella sp.]|jgi:hypothetical protein|nr:PorT family protein [Tannerella sp.]